MVCVVWILVVLRLVMVVVVVVVVVVFAAGGVLAHLGCLPWWSAALAACIAARDYQLALRGPENTAADIVKVHVGSVLKIVSESGLVRIAWVMFGCPGCRCGPDGGCSWLGNG